jgi:uroporphyrinogen-III synthase
MGSPLQFDSMSLPTFAGLRVLSLESRRAREMVTLIATHGGRPTVAPSMREVPLESNPAAVAFAEALIRGEFDIVILLTGVGTRVLIDVVARALGGTAEFIAALGRVRLAVRGPKPHGAIREVGLTPWVVAPEPNTWRELVAAIDATGPSPLAGRRVAVQEYGVANEDLLQALAGRGATVTSVPVYQWALPEDLEPLEGACRMLVAGEIDVVLFTTSLQAVHLLQVADGLGLGDGVRASLNRTVIASIGPTTSEELHAQGLDVDLEPSHPKMGVLVRETAERARALRALKATST